MKHFYIILNPYKSGAVEMAEKISQYLESRGCICHMPERMERRMEITLVTVIRILVWFRRMWNV